MSFKRIAAELGQDADERHEENRKDEVRRMSIDKIRAAMNKAEGAVQAVGGVALLIAEHVPGAADIIAADLENADMSLGADWLRREGDRLA